MAKDGTNRGGRRVRASDKPQPLAEKITAGKAARVLEPPKLPSESLLEAGELDGATDLRGEDMPAPSDYLSARQKDEKQLGADALFIETWKWLKERGCEKFVNPRLLEAYAQAFTRYIQCEEAISTYGLMKSTERFEKVNIDRLVPYARNARTHSKEQILQLRASLREFGFVNPVIVDKDLNIIAGHGRILAAKEEGLSEVPCVFAEHLTQAQMRAYIIADNRLAMNAGWDAEMLSVEIAELQGADFDVSLLCFDDAELNKFMGDFENVKDDDFDVDGELQKPATTRQGDLWLLGSTAWSAVTLPVLTPLICSWTARWLTLW